MILEQPLQGKMRIKEILESTKIAKLPTAASSAMPSAITSPSMDQYYEYYRFLVAIAGFPDKDTALDGPIQDGPLLVPYSQIEHDHSVALLKKMGKSPKFLNAAGSSELEKRNVVSPVRKFVDPDGM